MAKPTIYYFNIRGRAEVMKLALEYAKVAYEIGLVDYQTMKADKEHYPFGQCPRYTDDQVDLVQSNTILRYIARKYNLDGKTDVEKAIVDMAMEGVESLRGKYVALIYQDQLAEPAKEAFAKAHIHKDSTAGRNGGAHLDYLDWFLRKSGTGHVAGTSITMGDLCVWEMLDLLLRVFPDIIKAEYPALAKFHADISEAPGIKEYLASDRRLAQVNNNNLG
uniref:glutathione transferase n=1 Tax=Chlamydomonas leiostraca TaxID=1034604 RepID=A0A7S0WFA7_9CHLO|mmetsp:Transcript_12267/g.29938  ORF Transcript_12267/g.29938 Transcript_12267/m.29938 type:complete len:220 (+) Transcript_12267:60-719(+)|eukprot:CAMPEP_0202857058 /NCGR_PEP_ID=MMETSP1391-20130828/143_1 /ASSEMBLY_ACC=CAM_ASM_000867 /TAXON_ID=1034604 /ORGANISM="Chlamydomonas leiostraca, Strain SAG 11-49" /LENGTH=219 /DNA_ID=CAMNT_0049535815 /DNA_START=48 /DNA_END=707 /DNA_ORIENTATION=-